jgi:hypothetical protein
VEVTRELATLMMLGAIGYLSGNTSRSRLAFFLLAFAVWDIAYYAWLKVFINWPTSLLEWDILFLIPFTWLGPVLAPLICSLTMIILAWQLLRNNERVPAIAWTLLVTGSAMILFTFMEDYGRIVLGGGFIKHYFYILQNQDFIKFATAFTPETYNWLLFAIGELLIAGGIASLHGGQNSVARFSSAPGS